MNIWIVNPYGNLPGEGWRPYRATMLGEALSARGHSVVWWVSNFEHRSKKFRTKSWQDRAVNERFLIRIVPSTPYHAHISVARIRYERSYARNLRQRALLDGVCPDIIVIAEPAPFISGIVMDVVRSTKARLVIDVIDLWPELFAIALPRVLRAFSRLIFAPIYCRREWLFRRADAYMAVTDDYLALARRQAPERPAAVVYWGIDVKSFRAKTAVLSIAAITKLPVKAYGDVWVIYAGTLGDNYDLRTIMRCGERVQAAGLNARILLAGDGPLRAYVERTIREKGLSCVSYLGALDVEILEQLYAKCDIALSSYVADSTVSMPIKAFDYLAAGLPVVNSLGRDFGQMVVSEGVGMQYQAESSADLFRVLRVLVLNKELRESASSNALAQAVKFDSCIQYKKAVQLLESLG